MLTIPGPKSRFCDGMSRRSWLQIGSLAMGGLTLPQILRGESQGGPRKRIKGVIMVILPGGPTHLDMYDLKPDAPIEIRGDFRPIATTVPGMEICELMPRLAGMADKLALIRSLVGFQNDHNTHWCTTGWESHAEMPASPLVPGVSTWRLAVDGLGVVQTVWYACAWRSGCHRPGSRRNPMHVSSCVLRRHSQVISAQLMPDSKLARSIAAISCSMASAHGGWLTGGHY